MSEQSAVQATSYGGAHGLFADRVREEILSLRSGIQRSRDDYSQIEEKLAGIQAFKANAEAKLDKETDPARVEKIIANILQINMVLEQLESALVDTRNAILEAKAAINLRSTCLRNLPNLALPDAQTGIGVGVGVGAAAAAA